jgi:hypothetical protein
MGELVQLADGGSSQDPHVARAISSSPPAYVIMSGSIGVNNERRAQRTAAMMK